MQKKVRKKEQIAPEPVYCELCGQRFSRGFLWIDKGAGKVWVICEKCGAGIEQERGVDNPI